MDTLTFGEINYRKFFETAIEVSIIGVLIFAQSIPILAWEERIANVTPLQVKIDTGPISEEFTNTFSKEKRQEEFNDRIRKKYPKAAITDVTSGVKHIKLTRYYNNRPVRINIIEVDNKLGQNYKLKPALASNNTLKAKNTIRTIATREKAIVALNGTFFKPQTGVPLGTLMINNKMYTGPIYDRVAMGIFENGSGVSYDIKRVQFNAEIKVGEKNFKVDNINQPRMLSTYLLIYTPEWGSTSPATPKYGMQIAVKDKKVIAISSQSIKIPEGGYVLSGPEKIISQIALGKKVELNIKTNPEWKNVKHIISGGPYLVKNGQPYVDVAEEKLNSIGGRNPRSAIGYTADNDFIFVAVDGREGSSVGMSLWELAKFMHSLGCVNAMNLDGGGSTVMYVKGQIVNNPAFKGGIALSNALVLAED